MAVMRRCVLVLCLCGCFSESEVGADPSSSSGGASSSESSSSTSGSETTGSTSTAASTADTSSTTEAEADSSSSSGADESSSTGTPPVQDWALYFDGAASASSDALDLALGTDFTVELWARLDSADAHGTIAAYRGAGTSGWALLLAPGTSEVTFGVYDNNGVWNEVVGSDIAEIDPGWHHLAATKHGTTLYLHIDGAVDATAPCTAQASAPTVALQIGTGDGDVAGEPLLYVGIDDLRVSATARYQGAFVPEAEFAIDMDTRVYLDLEEGDGDVTIDGVDGRAFDLIGIEWIPGNTR